MVAAANERLYCRKTLSLGQFFFICARNGALFHHMRMKLTLLLTGFLHIFQNKIYLYIINMFVSYGRILCKNAVLLFVKFSRKRSTHNKRIQTKVIQVIHSFKLVCNMLKSTRNNKNVF